MLSPDSIHPLEQQFIIENRTPKNTPASFASISARPRPDFVKLDARVTRGDDKAASKPGVLDGVESTLFAPPRDADDHSTARPREDGDTVRVLRLGEAESGSDLALARVEDQAGDLGVAVDRGELGAGQGVEEVYAPVVAAASCGDERGLPGSEGYGLASGVERERVLLSPRQDCEDVALLDRRCGGRVVGRVDSR